MLANARRPTPDALRLIVTLASVSFAALGVCMILPGALLPLLVDKFHMRLVEAGSMMALQPIGYLLAVACASRVIAALGMRRALRGGFFTTAAGYAGFGLAASWAAGSAMMFVAGVGIGTVEVAANALIVRAAGDRSAGLLNFAHLFFGIGSVVTPAIATQVVALGGTVTQTFLVTAAVTAAVAVGWSLLNEDAASDGSGDGEGEGLHRRFIVLCAAMLAVYVGTEMGIGNWLTKYLVSARGVDLTTAGRALSLYWLGLTIGRLGLSFLSHRFTQQRLLFGLTLFAATFAWAALLAPSVRLEIAGFTLLGLGFSGIFPGIISLGGRFHPHNTAQATSIMIGGAGLGGIVIPWVMSGVADAISLPAGMAFYASMCFVMIALAVALQRSMPQEV
ncbi:MAG: MFS transporter [Deltaproteobacteria bacterium]|nr:MFS transporter [Deltaproteobacteria bacterium]